MRARVDLSYEEQIFLNEVLRKAAKKMGLQRRQKMPKEIKRDIIDMAICEIKKMRKSGGGNNNASGLVATISDDPCYSWAGSVYSTGIR